MKSDNFFYHNIRSRHFALVIATSILFIFNSLSFIQAQNKKVNKKSSADQDTHNFSIFNEKYFSPLNIEKLNKGRIYAEIVLEDFEVNNYSNKNIRFIYEKGKDAGISIRTIHPAPILGSKRYLGIKVLGKREDAVSIYPVKPIKINDYCEKISIWVYGKGLSGMLSIMISDATKNTFKIPIGKMNHSGWRKMSFPIGRRIIQNKIFVNQANFLRIISLVYNPSGNKNQWNYIYIDDLTATVRKKFTGGQPDNW